MALAGAVALAAGCSGQSMSVVGVSPPRAVEHSATTVDGAAPEPPPVPADFRSHMARVRDRFLSHGHGERFFAILWANDLAQDPARGRDDGGTDLPDGALFVEEAVVHDTRGDRSAGLLVMGKQGGTWHFDAVDAEGNVASRDRVIACATCHRDARDDVFR